MDKCYHPSFFTVLEFLFLIIFMLFIFIYTQVFAVDIHPGSLPLSLHTHTYIDQSLKHTRARGFYIIYYHIKGQWMIEHLLQGKSCLGNLGQFRCSTFVIPLWVSITHSRGAERHKKRMHLVFERISCWKLIAWCRIHVMFHSLRWFLSSTFLRENSPSLFHRWKKCILHDDFLRQKPASVNCGWVDAYMLSRAWVSQFACGAWFGADLACLVTCPYMIYKETWCYLSEAFCFHGFYF